MWRYWKILRGFLGWRRINKENLQLCPKVATVKTYFYLGTIEDAARKFKLKQRGKISFSICSHYEFTSSQGIFLLSLCSHFYLLFKPLSFSAVHLLLGCSSFPTHAQRHSAFPQQTQPFKGSSEVLAFQFQFIRKTKSRLRPCDVEKMNLPQTSIMSGVLLTWTITDILHQHHSNPFSTFLLVCH